MTKIIHSPMGQIDLGKMLEVITTRNICSLTEIQRAKYYIAVCLSLRLNPVTKPLDYIKNKDGGLTLFVNQIGAAQLRQELNITVEIISRTFQDDMYVVVARAKMGDRTDESLGVVPIKGLEPKHKANAMMKAETLAKRRVTVSICGLNVDESQSGQEIKSQFYDPPADVIDIDAEELEF